MDLYFQTFSTQNKEPGRYLSYRSTALIIVSNISLYFLLMLSASVSLFEALSLDTQVYVNLYFC